LPTKKPTTSLRIKTKTTLKLAEYKLGREQIIHDETGGRRHVTTDAALDELLESEAARGIREHATRKKSERL
jgi:hypothetical protein